tara:strand:+ start:21 stop:275 length:255 start_codon:yes stop_codon:yes gene_type:complete
MFKNIKDNAINDLRLKKPFYKRKILLFFIGISNKEVVEVFSSHLKLVAVCGYHSTVHYGHIGIQKFALLEEQRTYLTVSQPQIF